jgi:hypothetical protein
MQLLKLNMTHGLRLLIFFLFIKNVEKNLSFIETSTYHFTQIIHFDPQKHHMRKKYNEQNPAYAKKRRKQFN